MSAAVADEMVARPLAPSARAPTPSAAAGDENPFSRRQPEPSKPGANPSRRPSSRPAPPAVVLVSSLRRDRPLFAMA